MNRGFIARSRHPALTILDQAASGASNFLLVLIVGRVASLRQVGSFALLYAFYIVMLACVRSSIGQSILLRPGAHGRYRSPVAAALLAGGIVAPVLVIVSLATSDPALVLIAFGLPLLLAQDVLRYVFISRRNIGPALLADGFWALALACVLGVTILAPQVRVDSYDVTAVWLCGGGLGAAFLFIRSQHLDPPPADIQLRTWIREQKSLGLGLLAETMLSLAIGQLTPILLVTLVGLDQVGIYRLAQTSVAPLSNAAAAFSVAAVPYYRGAMADGSPRRRLPFLILAMPVIAALYGTILLLIPRDAADAVFGTRFHLASRILLPVVLAQVLLCASLGVGLIFPRVQVDVRLILRVRLWTILNEPALVAVLSLLAGLVGAAWGVCAAQAITLSAWCSQVIVRKPRHAGTLIR